ncbi:putative RING finger protein C2F3.16 [Cladobotryum mycophilum]|uniref:RING finger protein C2F3.16 n=1 Tax=Cladobotryum mycophilum TaxID=491253 RepID=A0ABR0T0C9_9HYPO
MTVASVDTCRACITTSIESSHKCIERSTDCDCPICGEYMFTSPKPVVFMPCGHSIHKKCYEQHMKVSYKCPICNKSLANMETQFRNLEVAIQNQPMPPEFRDTQAKILCNDCSGRSTVPYHWLGLKCSICRSYNTVELQMLGGNSQALQEAANDRAQASIETNPQEATPAARPTPISADPRVTASIASRRRHSSNVVEPLSRVLDRFVRSVSPPSTMAEHAQASLGVDEDSDNDILGFWRQADNSSDEEEYDSEEESDDGEQDDDDDDDDDENEIILFGHR